MRTVIINGTARSGKDTFVAFCDLFALTQKYSSVDGIKHLAQLIGWNGVKDEKSRRFLSDMKDLCTEFCDFPMRDIQKAYDEFSSPRIGEGSPDILFLMIREPEEIERAKERFAAITLLLKRPGLDKIKSNHADANVDDYDYDYTIYNNGTLENLKAQAEDFVGKVLTGFFDGDEIWS